MVHEEATGGTILGEVVNYVKPLWNIATGEHSHWIHPKLEYTGEH